MLPRLALQGPGAASIPTTLGATWDCHHGLLGHALPTIMVQNNMNVL
ncbi:MAG: hypothetical protein IH939_09735 [Acidobacteria bacterium]|nr:hypothetical protein [Acidobacteriota bacterium]